MKPGDTAGDIALEAANEAGPGLALWGGIEASSPESSLA
eukprot:CAMPEP_0173471962 /NCGR_PEP_ID=MMETSP1357-20121228/78661_1 /TAXON_ID=77926 /ORGANISM="Hemiselmis rufescens, Strain PCC563" /LENGTH=38 /DNA_ID= /DNA_START= /DNA_END= /DNA_ORIENTATION=